MSAQRIQRKQKRLEKLVQLIHGRVDREKYKLWEPLYEQIRYVMKLSDEHINTIENYMFRWTDVNYYLHYNKYPTDPDLHFTGHLNKKYSPDELVLQTLKDIKNFEEMFEDVPPLTQNIIVYRGQYDEYENRDTYMSTSLELLDAKEYATFDSPMTYKITIPVGTKILPLSAIALREDHLRKLGHGRYCKDMIKYMARQSEILVERSFTFHPYKTLRNYTLTHQNKIQ